jgi:hypothetical protein
MQDALKLSIYVILMSVTAVFILSVSHFSFQKSEIIEHPQNYRLIGKQNNMIITSAH